MAMPGSMLTPVRLPPGCARLVINPAATGSPVIATIGIVEVAAMNAVVRSLRLVTMTSGLWLTTSSPRA